MKATRKVGRAAKSFFNVPRWMGWEQISSSGKSIFGGMKTLFVPEKAKRVETFEQAVQRMNLSEEDLQKKAKSSMQLSIIYALFGLVLAAYTIYLIIGGYWLSFAMSAIVTALAFAFSYRENFWYFQVKSRKLGCTFKEWVNFCLRGFRVS